MVRFLKNTYLRLSLFWALMRLLRNPQRTDLVWTITDALRKLGSLRSTKALLEADPAARSLIRERKLMDKIDLESLGRLPAGSLGRCFAEHMIGQGFDPEFYPALKIENDETYIIMRIRQTHDLFHLVTGFKTDPVGEYTLQAFTLAYLATPLSAILLGGPLLRYALSDGETLGMLSTAILRGASLAGRARGVFAYDWEANWSKPLAEVRRELNLEPLE